MCTPEEPTYFVDPRQLAKLWPYMWDQGFWRGEDQYLRLFESAGDAEIVGEASTNYSKLPLVPNVAERIFQFNDKARFIYLLRDPVERTLSHYWHMVRHHAENRHVITAIKEDSHFTDVSYYAMQLEPYFRFFSPDRVHVLTYEELINTPRETMHALYEWLGVDPADVDVSILEQPENVTPEVIRMAAGPKLMHVLKNTRPVRAVAPRLPLSIRKAGRRLSTSTVNRRFVDTSDVIEYLRPIQRKQTDELTQLLGRRFPEWNRLDRQFCGVQGT
jgi:hypothetical protein